MSNELILPRRITKSQIISGNVDYLIRIGDKNKWSRNAVFNVKESHIDSNPISVVILKSEQVYITNLSLDILKRCGYNSKNDFKISGKTGIRHTTTSLSLANKL